MTDSTRKALWVAGIAGAALTTVGIIVYATKPKSTAAATPPQVTPGSVTVNNFAPGTPGPLRTTVTSS